MKMKLKTLSVIWESSWRVEGGGKMKTETFHLINFLNITIALGSTESQGPAVESYESGNVFEFEWSLTSLATN